MIDQHRVILNGKGKKKRKKSNPGLMLDPDPVTLGICDPF
jgi:hypothetical protein